MTDALPLRNRRQLLGLLTSLPFAARALTARASAAPLSMETATMLVAGPNGGGLDRWSRVVQPALAGGLPPETTLRCTSVGGADGVTAANQFGARVEPDGRTLLLAPGEAALAWLVGDPRAQYDVGRWMSVMAAMAPGILIARPGSIAPDRRVRIAVASVGGPDLPALLAIDLLGARAEPLPAPRSEPAEAAFLRGDADAVFLRGHKVPAHAADLARAGGSPAFTLGTRDEAGAVVRCSAFPDVPTFDQFFATIRGRIPAGPLHAAWHAAATASQMEFALVLPQLTPASAVALWRRAGAEAAASLPVQAMALALGVRAVGGQAAATAAAAATDQAALIALRRWLADRFNWRPA